MAEEMEDCPQGRRYSLICMVTCSSFTVWNGCCFANSIEYNDKNTFPYDKLIQLLIWQIVKPTESIVMGGTWRVPVLMKLLDRNFVKDLKSDGTFNEASFSREYRLIVLYKCN